jgi:hypothetical protein
VNAARIFRLIETVVNGIADILAGNTGGMAKAVEKALASLIAPVIDFLADYIGIGDLPEKIKKTVEGFQAWIEGILDKVIGFLADKAKSLLKALGLGGDDKKKEGPAGYDGSIGEEMSFSADGEPHKVWIVTNGDDSVAMMSSKTKTVAEQLDEHEKAAGDDKALVAKISAARAQHTKLNAIADKMAKEVAAAKDDESKKELGTKDEEVEKEEKELVRMLKEIGESIGANFATEQNPAPVEWPKRRATAYPVIYAGPRTENYLPQDLLRSRDINAIGKELKPPEKKAWDDKDNPIEAMVPTEQKALPDGGATVGIGQPNQVEPGMLLHVTDPGTTAGGGKINREFRPYGFRPGKEGLDGDHVVERQMGGPDTIENLWPLDSSENRGAGSALSQKKFPKEITKSKDMDMNMLKDKARKKGGVWFRIVSTEG